MLTLIKNAQVFAPDDLGMRNLLLGGGQILALSEDEIVASGATVLDLEGRRLVPGFIDGHVHGTGGGGESGFASRVPPLPVSHFSAAGVTSVVGVLGTDDTTRDTKSLLAQTRALREEGLGAWCHTGGYHLPPVTLTGSVRDGGVAFVLDGTVLTRCCGDSKEDLCDASEISITLSGAARHNTANSLAAAALTSCLGVSTEVIAKGLKSVSQDDNPG